jgi:hypothetical protein
MKHNTLKFDAFSLFALLVLVVIGGIFYNSYIERNFPVFTTEEEIDEAIEREFPQFADYL